MKMFNAQVSTIETGKISQFQMRVLMGYIDRKPHKYYQTAKEAIEYYKPKLSSHDTSSLTDMLRRRLMSRDSVVKKGITQEQRDQFALITNIFVSGIKRHDLSGFLIHIPIYQIEFEPGQYGFRFYISANKPVFL